MVDLALILFGYLSGSLIFGELIAKAKGIDLRSMGSGNVGATNVSRALGKKFGAVVFFLDMLKGLIPTALAVTLKAPESLTVSLVGTAAVLGHMFPVFHRFQGGKGVATAFGVVLGISWKPALILIILWAMALYITRFVSVASMLSSLSAIIVFLALDYPPNIILMALIISALIIFKHRSNIQRLIAGEEPKI